MTNEQMESSNAQPGNTKRVDVVAVMKFCSEGFVNGSKCSTDLLECAHAVAKLIATAKQMRDNFAGTLALYGCDNEYIHRQLAEFDDAIARATGASAS